MLVLARSVEQSIIIGDEIKITVIGVRGKKVRLGITAPGHVTVHREEVYLTLKRQTPGDDLPPDTTPSGPHRLRRAG